MSSETDPLFPDGLSDEAATALCDFLFELAAAADSRFLAQILRYRRQHQNPPLDPDHPWRSG
jgi:hypothetical protein